MYIDFSCFLLTEKSSEDCIKETYSNLIKFIISIGMFGHSKEFSLLLGMKSNYFKYGKVKSQLSVLTMKCQRNLGKRFN